MSEVWGLLEKSLTDSEKINEAIDAAIAAHEADASAHLGAGESLLSHKASTIIDHAAHSVVRDKMEFDRFQLDTAFESLDGWTNIGTVTQLGIGDMKIEAGPNEDDYAEATLAVGAGITGQAGLAVNPLLQIRMKATYGDDQSIFMGNFNKATPAGFGFVVYNDEVNACWVTSGGSLTTEQIAAVAPDVWHTYETVVTDGTTIKWYVDGVLKKTMTSASITECDRIASIRVVTGSSGARSAHVAQIHFDADMLD